MQTRRVVIRVLLLVSCYSACALALNAQWDNDWAVYKTEHEKVYSSNEEMNRREIWEDNVRYIERHNREADRGQHTFTLGMNEFGDMTQEEFMSTMMGQSPESEVTVGESKKRPGPSIPCGKYKPPVNITAKDLPFEVDWRKKGYVTNIKHQGSCGSCYAFAAVGSLEGQHFRKTGSLISLSVQNIVDCSKGEGNSGCGGGTTWRVYSYIIRNRGIDTDRSYSYIPVAGYCRFKRENVGATMKACSKITRGSELKLAIATASVGPIAVGVDAGHPSFRLYKSGVYFEPQCEDESSHVTHAVLAIGYGVHNGTDYWLLKNSWGTRWGMQGFGMLRRNKDNHCGIASQGIFPVV